MECFYYTSKGIPPYLASHSFASLQIAFPQFYSTPNLFSSISLKQYAGIQNASLYLTVRDLLNAKCTVEGSSNPNFVKIGVPTNKQLTVEDYMSFAEKAQAEYVVSLAEEAPLSSGKHRCKRSARNSVSLLAKSLALHREFKLLGNIQGGNDLDARAWCAKQMKNMDCDGYVIGGIGAEDSGESVRRIVERVHWELKGEGKLIVLAGTGRPLDLVYAAAHGVTGFEVAWPFLLAERGRALGFSVGNLQSVGEIEHGEFCEIEVDLNDEVHRRAKGPIVPDCECFTCRAHHRGYVHHLLKIKEMNAKSLLAIHNTHVYSKLVDCLATAKLEGRIDQVYTAFVEKCCASVWRVSN